MRTVRIVHGRVLCQLQPRHAVPPLSSRLCWPCLPSSAAKPQGRIEMQVHGMIALRSASGSELRCGIQAERLESVHASLWFPPSVHTSVGSFFFFWLLHLFFYHSKPSSTQPTKSLGGENPWLERPEHGTGHTPHKIRSAPLLRLPGLRCAPTPLHTWPHTSVRTPAPTLSPATRTTGV